MIEFKLSLPALILLAINFYYLFMHLSKHRMPTNENYDGPMATVSYVIMMGLYYWAGVFG